MESNLTTDARPTKEAALDGAAALVRVRWYEPLVLLLATLVIFAPIVLHPTNTIYSPYSDILAQHYPFRYLLAKGVREQGRLPLWNPTTFCGMPLIGDPQAALFYPPNWLHVLLPPEIGYRLFGFLILGHLWIGGCGMLAWLSRHGIGPLARIAGALAFMFAGKYFFHVVTPGHVIFLPLMWYPWQLALIDRLLERVTPLRVAGLALLMGMVNTGCHPQLLFYANLFLAAYVVVRLTRTPSRAVPVIGGMLVATLLGAGLAAAHLIPIVDLLDAVIRGEGLSYEDAAKLSLTLPEYITFLLPDRVTIGRWENTSYLGRLSLALVILSAATLRRGPFRREAVFCLLAILFAAWFSMGEHGGLHWFLHHYVPGFGLFRIASRMFLMLGLPAGYLVARAVQGIADGVVTRPMIATAALLALIGLGIGIVDQSRLAWLAACMFTVPLAALVPSLPANVRAVTLTSILFLDLWAFCAPLVQSRPMAVAVPPNPVVEMLRRPYGEQRVYAVNYAKFGMYSVIPVTYATPAGLEELRGFNPLVPRFTFQYLRTGIGQEPLEWKSATSIRNVTINSRPHLDLLNVGAIASNEPLDVPGLSLVHEWGELPVYHFAMDKEGDLTLLPQTYLYRNDQVLPRAFVVGRAEPSSDVAEAIGRIGSFDPKEVVLLADIPQPTAPGAAYQPISVEHDGDRLTLTPTTDQPGYLFLSEMWYRGWKGTLDGQPVPIHRANGVFMAIELPAGTHRVVLRYEPDAYRLGLLVSGITLAAVAGLSIWGICRPSASRRGAEHLPVASLAGS